MNVTARMIEAAAKATDHRISNVDIEIIIRAADAASDKDVPYPEVPRDVLRKPARREDI